MPIEYNTYFNVLTNRYDDLINEEYKVPSVNDVFYICYKDGVKLYPIQTKDNSDLTFYREYEYRKWFYRVIEIVDDTLKCKKILLFKNENNYLFYNFPLKTKDIFGFSIKKYWCIHPKKQNSIIEDNTLSSWFPN
jgi:hypothetical protein